MEKNQNFEEFKKQLLEENEKNYGDEIREEYGEDVYEASADILAGLTEEKWKRSEELRIKAEDMLQRLAPLGNPTGEEAMEMARLHGEWASIFWEDGKYSPEAHLAIAEMYVSDERFSAYYDAIAEGGAQFLYKAVKNYCEKLMG